MLKLRVGESKVRSRDEFNPNLVRSVHVAIGFMLRNVGMTGPELNYLLTMMTRSACKQWPDGRAALANILVDLASSIREGAEGEVDGAKGPRSLSGVIQ